MRFKTYMVFNLGSPQTPDIEHPIVSGYMCIFLNRDPIVSSRFSVRSLTQVQNHWTEPRTEAHLVHSELREGGGERGDGMAHSGITGL